jgi:hypothetical protein
MEVPTNTNVKLIHTSLSSSAVWVLRKADEGKIDDTVVNSRKH